MTIEVLETKSCSRCRAVKQSTDFYSEPRNRDGFMGICKQCIDEASHQSYLRNKDRVNARSFEWRKKHPDKAIAAVIKHRTKNRDRFEAARIMYEYGITFQEYDALLTKQNGTCAICRLPCATGRKLCIDHDHKTGKVRGLLCRTCNSGIGLLKEDIDTLKRAVQYLNHL